MSLKTFKPYTKSSRGTVLVDRKHLWKGKPLKQLSLGKASSGGRNNLGRITSIKSLQDRLSKWKNLTF